jgi:hypothetical protein
MPGHAAMEDRRLSLTARSDKQKSRRFVNAGFLVGPVAF